MGTNDITGTRTWVGMYPVFPPLPPALAKITMKLGRYIKKNADGEKCWGYSNNWSKKYINFRHFAVKIVRLTGPILIL